MGNVTAVVVRRDVKGTQRRVVVDITGSGAYATNGDTVVAADILKVLPEAAQGLTDVQEWECEPSVAGDYGILDKVNKKIKLMNAVGTEKGNGTVQTGVTVRMHLTYGQVTG